jgi:hypothetical protein
LKRQQKKKDEEKKEVFWLLFVRQETGFALMLNAA